jgi:CheY-like chemotaxis protein
MCKPNILLAEDNPTNTLVIRALLGAVGLSITCVENGQEAVAAAERQPFDLILMDVQMPVMDGHTAIRRIRHAESVAEKHRCRIYTVTTNSFPEDVRASLDAGADGHITKPLAPGVLLDAVASVGWM